MDRRQEAHNFMPQVAIRSQMWASDQLARLLREVAPDQDFTEVYRMINKPPPWRKRRNV